MRPLLAALAAVAALGLAAGPASAKTVKLTIANAGDNVRVHQGDTISISLASNQTTPYHWVITGRPRPKVVKVTTAKYVGPGTGVPGQGGQQKYVLTAKGRGTTAFSAQYQEISSGDVGSGKSTFAITIQVRR